MNWLGSLSPIEEAETWPDLGGEGALASVTDFAKFASTQADHLKFKSGEPFDIFAFKNLDQYRTPPPAADNDVFVLASGAVEIVLELLRRFPLYGSDEDLLRWFGCALRLGQAIGRLGLWRAILHDPWFPVINKAGLALQARSLQSPPPWNAPSKFGPVFRTFFDGALLVQSLLCGWPSPDRYPEHEMREFISRTIRHGRFSEWWGPRYPRTDPIDDLAGWPVPLFLAVFAGSNDGTRTGAYDLLCGILGSPNGLAKGNFSFARRAAAVVIFAATHVTSSANPVTAIGLPMDDLANAALSHATRAGLAWLIEQFPTRVFPGPIEELIKGASVVQYA
jgi:hypothetical protein